MTQTERITHMEQRLERATKALQALENAYTEYMSVSEDFNELEKYLGSDEWHADRQADADGLLPDGMRRGVLSEDGIWNLLERRGELIIEIKTNKTKEL